MRRQPAPPYEVPRELPQAILDNLLEGCQLISPDYRYLYVNEAVARHGRTTRERLLGRRMAEVYPDIENTSMFSTLQRCMNERTAVTMENEFSFPDGDTGWFELRFEPVPDGVAILSVDITARKDAERVLQRTMRGLTTLSQCNQILVRAVDERQLTQEICRSLVESVGYPMAAITRVEGEGRRQPELVASQADQQASAELARGLLSDCPWAPGHIERVFRTGTPETRAIDREDPEQSPWTRQAVDQGLRSCLTFPIQESTGRIGTITVFSSEQDAFNDDERALLAEVGLDLGHGFGMLRARTAQAQTFSELKEEQARTRALYDHLPQATFVWKHDNPTFTLADFNRAAHLATGGDVEQALGTAPPESSLGIPRLQEDLHRCLTSHETVERELDCELGAGQCKRRMVLTYGLIPPDRVLLQAQDVTEQRRTEEQLMASQRLEAVGRLAGGIAHDFNNLLSVILSYTDFAHRRLEDDSSLGQVLTEVHDAGQRAATLTNQLLAFSRKQVLEPQVTSLNGMVGGIEGMLYRLLGEDIDFRVALDPQAGNVMADPAKLEQIVMNLALNARDAMPHGGKLTIETANVEPEADHADGSAGRFVRLSVTDTGTGMTPETRKHIFEPFYTTKELGKGTGLGLSMVYGIIEQSGGHIDVESEPGRGTTFKIDLPRVEAVAVERGRRESTVPATGTETILLVEDDEKVQRAAARILRSAGYRVLRENNGRDAIRRIEEQTPSVHLLLTDVVMPELDGPQLAERLKERNPNLKVLFTSGYTESAIVHRGVLDADARFLSKPFTETELTQKVRQVLDE